MATGERTYSFDERTKVLGAMNERREELEVAERDLEVAQRNARRAAVAVDDTVESLRRVRERLWEVMTVEDRCCALGYSSGMPVPTTPPRHWVEGRGSVTIFPSAEELHLAELNAELEENRAILDKIQRGELRVGVSRESKR